MDTRITDETTELRESIDRMLLRVNTCIPGVIDSFDPANQTASVRPSIKARINLDGKTTFRDLPQIINAPVIFPFAITAGFALTLPIKAGDACVILFSQRSIDNWHNSGGVQPPEDGVSTRHHDLTDALVMMAASPLPNVLSGWAEDGIELRNTAQNSRVTLKDSIIEIVRGATSIKITDTAVDIETTDATVKADLLTVDAPESHFTGHVTIDGGLDVLGLAKALASLIITGSITNNGKDIGENHAHSQDPDNDGDIQQNTNGVL